MYLALLVLVFSLWIAEFAAYFTNHLFSAPHLLFSTHGLPLLFGPFLFFYTKSLNGQKPLVKKWNWLHFLPLLLHLLYQSPFFLESATFKTEVLKALRNTHKPPEFSAAFYIIETLKFLQLVIYLILTQVYLKKNLTSLKGGLLIEHKNWVKKLWIGLSLFAIFDLSYVLGIFLFQYDYILPIARMILFSGAIIIYYIGYATLRQPEIIAGDVKTFLQEKSTIRYEKSALSEEKSTLYLTALEEKMAVEKLWLNSELKLSDLADSLDISKHHLSQILNESLQKNFYDFVNEYRVKSAQEMLANPNFNQYTILSIAYQAGFKNKASFNSAFKKHSGMTPSEYKKRFVAN